MGEDYLSPYIYFSTYLSFTNLNKSRNKCREITCICFALPLLGTFLAIQTFEVNVIICIKSNATDAEKVFSHAIEFNLFTR